MQRFETLTAKAAALPTPNIDTDQIIPSRFLKIVTRQGLADGLFSAQRFDETGAPRPAFALNRPENEGARVLVAGDNFGCGSSREHAVWALMDFGISCVISTSFSDIFANNAVKNGLLAAVVARADLDRLERILSDAPGLELTVDLPSQTITAPNHLPIPFAIDAFAKARLLGGLDEVGLTLQHEGAIAAYEGARAKAAPWTLPAEIEP